MEGYFRGYMQESRGEDASFIDVGRNSTHTVDQSASLIHAWRAPELTTRPASSPVYTTVGRGKIQLIPAEMLAPLSRLLSV